MKQERILHLEREDAQILRWLACYPFQRSHDLVVALSPWKGRTVVYERLAALAQRRLIERVHLGVAGGKNVWHVSPLGISVCDQLAARSQQTPQERDTRWERLGTAPLIREEREKLLRLLPRLPVLFLLQEVVNGLVMHASSALTHQGRPARLVQWSWLREYCHAFRSARDQRFQVRVEGALALCLHGGSGDHADQPGTKTDAGARAEEQWYTLFLLHCPLDDIHLIRLRLDRLLRWRESAERTAVYSQMPPLLVLATTQRQAEWWHQIALQVAARLRVHRPLGVLACLPQRPEALENPWHLTWRRLGTKELCHIQEVLHPWPAPAVSELLAGRGGARVHPHAEEEARGRGMLIPLPPHRRFGTFALTGRPGARPPGRVRARIRPPQTWPEDYRLGSCWLTPRHWELLRLFFAHPLLSRSNVAQLLALHPITVDGLLRDLTHARYLVRTITPVDVRWQLAEEGLRLLARLAWCHPHHLGRVPLQEDAPLEQRGASGLLQYIQHTAGVYGFFAQLSEALATLPHACLRWWETGSISEQFFRYHEKTYRFRPDALASVQAGERQFRFWLEWDRGTMSSQELRIKFTTYAMYLLSREWTSSSPLLPALLCVAPHRGQEQRLAEAARHCLGTAPAAWRLYLTTASRLAVQGILAPIWQQVLLPQQVLRAPPTAARRVALFGAGETSA